MAIRDRVERARECRAIRDGDAVVLDEYYENPEDLYTRAETLRLEYLGAPVP